MKDNNNGRSPLRTPLIILVLVLLYAYGMQVTQIDLQEPLEPQRQENLIGLIREFAHPDFFNYENTTRSTNISLRMPCPEEIKGSQVTFEGRQVVLTPNCATNTQDLLTLTGQNFQANVQGAVFWYPIGANTPRRVADIRADREGNFTVQFTMPDIRPAEEAHRLEVVEVLDRRLVGASETTMEALDKILETVLMALMASTVGTLLAIPISFMAARNLMADVKLPLAAVMIAVLLAPLAGGLGWWLVQQAMNASGLSGVVLGLAGLGFVGNFIQVIFDLLVIVLPLLVGFILALIAASFGAGYGQELVMRLEAGVAKGVTAVLAVLGTAVFILILGYVLIGINFLGLLEFAPETLRQQLAVLLWPALILGVIAALLSLRYPAKRQYPIGMAIYTTTRGTLNILRSIEPLMMGFVFVVWVGLGPFAGILALMLHSIADLGKLFSEEVENINEGPREAITATGANSIQTIAYAVIPQVTPHYIAYIFYRWDINVRLSTIIGFVGGGGIGFVLQRFLNQLQYTRASVMVIAIALVVTILDYVSSRIRRRII
jgi:phosphonate ABC transporter permease subunit PhnE